MIDNKFFKFLKLDGLIETIKLYIDKRIQLFKLEAQEKAAEIIATLLLVFLTGLMFFLMLIFISLALGNYLNQLLNSTYLGYAVLAGFFLLLLLLFSLNIKDGFLHRRIHKMARGLFTKKTDK